MALKGESGASRTGEKCEQTRLSNGNYPPYLVFPWRFFCLTVERHSRAAPSPSRTRGIKPKSFPSPNGARNQVLPVAARYLNLHLHDTSEFFASYPANRRSYRR